MDKQTAINMIADTFNSSFNENRFRHFIRNLFNDFDEYKNASWITGYIKDSFKDHVKKYKRIGKYKDIDGNKLDVVVVHLRKESALDSARTMQRNFIASYLKTRGEKDAAVVAYFTDNTDDWRFSYIRMEYRQEITESGKIKVKEEFTPRRYSFLVGKNEPNHTAQQQLFPILCDDQNNPSLSELEKAFSVEAVTKKFYQDYKGLFGKLTVELERIIEKDSKIKKEFKDKSIDTANFAKKLLGQIVFLYFLQKKGWLGVDKDDKGNFKSWGTGPKNFLRQIHEKTYIRYNNFFNDVLEPLFYEALATERPGDYYSRFNCKIPFLNGGLFEPIGEYNWQETDILINNDLFSEIFKTFDQYNFTVREDEPLEKEVAVDPEMLGKVFENLLPENLRKGQGAYYTPREIVHYMCQESLINYLDTAVNTGKISLIQEKPTQGKLFGTPEPKQLGLKTTGYKTVIPRKDIENFICKGEFAIENDTAKEEGTTSYKYQVDESIRKNAQLLDEKLKTIKICDPAIGSGAFPVGMMHEIVKARNVLTTYLEESQSRSIYNFKRRCIQESIYGVDIDPGAIEIAKLRLWLSLVVDEENYLNIKPLPNLDYKIMQGNSLIELLSTESLVSSMDHRRTKLVKELKKAKDELFNITILTKKENKRCEIDILMKKLFEYDRDKQIKRLKDAILAVKSQRRLFEDDKDKKEDKKKIRVIESKIEEIKNIDVSRPTEHFEWHINYSEIFQAKGGFDVVIANPPFVEHKKLKRFSQTFKSKFLAYSGTADIYVYFFEQALNILSQQGVLTFITSNKFMKTRYGAKLRSLLLQNVIKNIVDFNSVHVFDALVASCILILLKARQLENKIVITKANDNILEKSNIYEFTKESSYNYDQSKLDDEIWYFESTQIQLLKDKIEVVGTKLKNIKELQICRGVTTGYNPAFIIDNVAKHRIITSNKEAAKIIKPLLQGRNIKKWAFYYDNLFLIFTRRGYDIDSIDSIKLHLESFKKYLRPKKGSEKYGRKPGNYNWFEIQDNVAYYKEFEKPKIIWGLTADKWAFAYDDKNHYLPSNGYILTSANLPVKYILAFLNSTLLQFYFGLIGIMTAGGAYTLKHETIMEFPVPIINDVESKPLITSVDKILSLKKSDPQADTSALEAEIDRMVYELYCLTAEEITIVEESVKR